ncbi:MAG: prepilin-type N-terminal cleavage/methylation domain-containing protein [Candidatus Dormibacteria bacterium]|jgi:general secretion pathway protein G
MNKLHNRVGRHRRGSEGGFTLIELLVVIAILSVLAAIVVINVTGVKNKGNSAACVTDVATVQTAVDEYIAAQVNGGLGVFTGASGAQIDPTTQGAALVPTYLNSAPTSCSSAATQWGNIDVTVNSGGDVVVSGSYS